MKPLSLLHGARRLRAVTGTAAAGCALGAVLAVPGLPRPPAPVTPAPAAVSPAPPSPAPGPPVAGPPVAVPPVIIVVQLSAGFSPSTLRLAVGQQFELTVSDSVQATGPAIPGTCPSGPFGGGPGALLFAQCVGNGSYLFTAEQPGSIVLSATVRPRCAPGTMCPQWIAEPTLLITITPGPPRQSAHPRRPALPPHPPARRRPA